MQFVIQTSQPYEELQRLVDSLLAAARDYPGMVTCPADTEGVTGELWIVDAAALLHLDDFEGVHEGLYRREAVTLLPPHEGLRVHTYLYNRDVSGRPDLGPAWTE